MLKKNKVDYRLVNLALIVLIFFLVYRTGNLWIDSLKMIISIIAPFVLAFALAYAEYPIVERLKEKKLSKGLSTGIVIFATVALAILIIYVVASVLVGQLSDLFGNISKFLNELANNDWNINISGLQETINATLKDIISDVTKYVSNGAINIIGSSISVIGNIFFAFAAYIYFLIDMDKIRNFIKRICRMNGEKTFKFVKLLDGEMKNYLSGLVEVMVISVFEYAIVYAIIGHPNALLLGFLAGVANLIPYFGGIACNCVAAITAFVISPGLFIRTVIAFFILSSVDSYLINPLVYGKSNSIHPLITIFVMFAGSMLFGIVGIFVAFPVAIIVCSAYRYYKEDINDGIEKIKDNLD